MAASPKTVMRWALALQPFPGVRSVERAPAPGPMHNGFEDHLRAVMTELSPIPDAEWPFFWRHVRQRRFARGEHVYREGQPARDLYFLLSGLVRLYHCTDGEELVRGFDYEGRFTALYESVITGCPARLNVQALEPVHSLTFSGSVLLQLYDRHPCWDRFGRRVLEQHLVRSQDKEMRFRLYGAEEHYRLLLARGSPLVGRVPLRQLASYLQITPETLSRIRSRVAREADGVTALVGERRDTLANPPGYAGN